MIPIPLLFNTKPTSLTSSIAYPCLNYLYSHPNPPFYGSVDWVECDGTNGFQVVTQGNSYAFCAISGSAVGGGPFPGTLTVLGGC
jgi:hypothetical protein